MCDFMKWLRNYSNIYCSMVLKSMILVSLSHVAELRSRRSPDRERFFEIIRNMYMWFLISSHDMTPNRVIQNSWVNI